MEFKSYAQFCEDVILYCDLQDVDKGFYIDVGAFEPEALSVTKAFYDRGWHGINIEPIRNACFKLAEQRPRDINLCIGLGEEHGKMELFGQSTGATFLKDVATQRKVPTDKGTTRIIWTLAEVYRQYPPPSGNVHFCKIDVEGYEKQVLLGVKDWRTFRPWIFCMETGPVNRSEHGPWEQILLDNEYIFALHDSINRYYVAAEREYLLDNFAKINQFVAENDIWQKFRRRIG